MRVRGRRLYPSTLAERRIMMSLGGVPLYTPRGLSPYFVARRLTRAAVGDNADIQFMREALARRVRKVEAHDLPTASCASDLDNASGEKPVAA